MVLFQRFWIAAGTAALLAGGAAATPALSEQARPARRDSAAAARPIWAHQASDLKPDPRARFGVLPNGMRYVIMKNATPAGEAAFRLHIAAGSLMEEDNQLGLAHFMEHMIFNGTRNVPEGEFVRRLERHGLAFGPDTNAYTSFDETVYMLELPETDTAVVDTALLLMREAGGEALMAAEAIDRERGVVLSEERTRDTPRYRMVRALYDFLLKGQRVPRRFPIGTAEIIRSAPRERFVSFYEAYYRPENATFVAVGDFDPAEMERKIRTRFADWRGQGPAGRQPDLGRVAPRRTETKVFHEHGAPASVQIAFVSPPDLTPDTRAKQRREWAEQLGLAVLNRRFERLARQDRAPFLGASADHDTQYRSADLTQVVATYRPGHWKPALEAIDQEQRRIVQHGVRQPELEREITETRARLQAAVAGQSTRRSTALASGIAASVQAREVFTSPQEDLAIFEEAVRDLTPERVSAAVRELMTGQGPLVFLSTPTAIAQAERTVAEAYSRSRAVAVAPPSAQAAKAWAYTDFGAPGRVAERREVADLKTTFLRFENGVRLTVRPSTVRKDEVLVAARVGEGELDLARDRPSPAWLANAAFTEGGLGRMTAEEIEEALAAKVYGLSLSFDDDAFVLTGKTRPQDLATQLQVLAAHLTDPAWRPQGFERMRAYSANVHDQVESTPAGVLGRDLGRLIRSGDRRWGLPSRQEMSSARLEELTRVLDPALSGEAVEVVVTGDVTVEEAIRQTAATFGALPRRRDASHPASATQVRFPPGSATPVRLTHKGRPDQAMAYIAWPTTDFVSDPQQARVLRVLEQVMKLRLTDEVREAQGVTYSPITSYDAAWVYPGFGYVAAGIEAPPDKLDPFFADALKIARELREKPPTQDELDRAVKPRVESIQRAQASNEYWLSQLAGAQTDPRRLTAIREAIPGLQRVTPAEVRRAAERFLIEAKAFRVVVVPESRPAR